MDEYKMTFVGLYIFLPFVICGGGGNFVPIFFVWLGEGGVVAGWGRFATTRFSIVRVNNRHHITDFMYSRVQMVNTLHAGPLMVL